MHLAERQARRLGGKAGQEEEGEGEGVLPPQLVLEWQQSQGHGCGFTNAGNTCFLNSVLQCLVHLPPWAQACRARLHRQDCQLTAADEKCVACLLEKRVVRSLAPNTPPTDAPNALLNNMTTLISRQLVRGRQEDAHEFLRCLLEAAERDMLRSLRGPQPVMGRLEPTTLIQHVFGGTLESTVTCGSCGATSHTRDPLMDLSLELAGCASVAAAFAKFSAPEELSGSNAYKCGSCKNKGVAKKQLAVLEAPHVLVVHLKRFAGPGGAKIARHIEFEERISLRSFCSPSSPELQPPRTVSKGTKQRSAQVLSAPATGLPAPPQGPGRFSTAARLSLDQPSGVQMLAPLQQVQPRRLFGPQLPSPGLQQHRAIGAQPLGRGASTPSGAAGDAADQDEEPSSALPANSPEYKLYGVVVHQGVSANSGHYYAFVRDGTSSDGEWYRMNDAVTYRCSTAKVQAENAYMLFYVRTSQRHYPTIASLALKAEKKRLRESERQAKRAALWKSGAADAPVSPDVAAVEEAAPKRRRFGFSVDAAERTWHTSSHQADTMEPAAALPPPREPLSPPRRAVGPSGRKLVWGAAPAAHASSQPLSPPAASPADVQPAAPQLQPRAPSAYANGVAATVPAKPPPWLSLPPPDLLPVDPPPLEPPAATARAGIGLHAAAAANGVHAPPQSPQLSGEQQQQQQQQQPPSASPAGELPPPADTWVRPTQNGCGPAHTEGGMQAAHASVQEAAAIEGTAPSAAPQLPAGAALSPPRPPALPEEVQMPDAPPLPEYGPQMPADMQTAVPNAELRGQLYIQAKAYFRNTSWGPDLRQRLQKWREAHPDSDQAAAKDIVLEELQANLPRDAQELVQRLLTESLNLVGMS